MIHHTFWLTLDHYEDIADNIRHFTFLSNHAVQFVPGQFITLHWSDEAGHRIHRNYSLANYGGYNDKYPNQLELAASYVEGGFASKRLFAMQPGDTIETSGPFGRLILRDEPVKRYILVATGTGVTPYRTMLSSLSQRMAEDPSLQVLLLFGVRYARGCLYRDEWVKFARQHPRVEVQVYCSRESYTEHAYERIGRVTKALHGALEVAPDDDIVYLCGNPDMIDEMLRMLSERGLSRNRIRQERYISPKKKKSP